MFIRPLASFFVLCLLVSTSFAGLVVEGKTKKERKIAKKAAKVEREVRKLGISKDSKVKVKTRSKKKINGYISDINDDGFEITQKNGEQVFVEYQDTKKIKGNNLHAGVWVAIGVGISYLIVASILGSLQD